MSLTAYLPPALLSGLADVAVSPGAGQSGYPLTWNNTLGKWVASPFPAPDYSGILSFTNATESTSSTTGGLILSGGLGVAKRINAGGEIACGSPSASTSQLTVSGGAVGGPLITLSRTAGTTIAFDWSLAGGALSFRNATLNQVCLMIGFSRFIPNTADLTVGYEGPSSTSLPGINSLLKGSDAGLIGVNTMGGTLIIASGRGTGNATPSALSFRTPAPGPSGTTLQSWVERMNISSTAVAIAAPLRATGGVNFANLPTTDTGLAAGDLWRDGNTVKVKI